ncbi:MAG: glycosyl transferase [Rhodobacteraceae bacterium]|nr:glycosyl transferase [Paracoccaceae bacterium]
MRLPRRAAAFRDETGQEADPPAGPRILYLAHDLADAAVARRLRMLQAAGARVTLAGFSRGGEPAAVPALVLGQTRNGRLAARVPVVARAAALMRRRLRGMAEPDLILARNLEMLVLARRAAALWAGRPRLVYEVLDIHRTMQDGGAAGRTLRWLERRLARPAAALVTSSPAFVTNHFRRHGQTAPGTAIILAENRPFLPEGPPPPPAPRHAPAARAAGDGEGGPVRIGWFGILRCAESLEALAGLTRRFPGRFRVILAGRPALDVLPGFHETLARCPDLAFNGPYRSPEDLPRLYGGCDLAWLVDRYEAGGNSEWLLPNRLYEGCLHGAVPVALAGTECARRLDALGIGLRLAELAPAEMDRALAGLDRAAIDRLAGDVAAVDRRQWHCDGGDAAAFLRAIMAPRRDPGSGTGARASQEATA